MARPSWTQACCNNCWDERNPGREASTIRPQYRETETCCYCGETTTSGIYVRVNPATVKFAVREKD